MKVERQGYLRRVGRIAIGLVAVAVVLWAVPMMVGAQSPSDETVATIDGVAVLESELETESAEQLEAVDLQRMQCELQAEEQRHEVLEGSAERVVRTKLLQLEADRTGQTADELAESIRASVPDVSQEDTDAWWEQNEGRVRQPRQDVEEQIKALLARTSLQTVEQDFFDDLRDRYQVEMMLQPFRHDVAHAGFPARGPASAPVTLVEFSDFECPYCKRVVPTIDQVAANYPDNVKVVFRQFPLNSIHANAQKAAEASLCAGEQGKFWEMHDLMFEEQKNLTVAELKDKAGRLELDQAGFDGCLDSGRFGEEVAKDLRAGSAIGVTGTPSIFVNGRKLSGAVDFETVAQVIEDELERAGQGG